MEMDFNKPYVCVLGGVNADIQGFVRGPLILRDSNVGRVRTSMGGVGRNIAENLVRLGIPTTLVSVVGQDTYGQRALLEADRLGLDTRHVLVLPDADTSTYLSVLDEGGDMLVAINQMDICDRMTASRLDGKLDVLKRAALCVMDTNFPAETLIHVIDAIPPEVPLFLDPVSTAKAERIKPRIGRFHTIKPNRLEAETLSGISIPEARGAAQWDALYRAVGRFHELGVRHVFISLGAAGTYCSIGTAQWHLPPPACQVVAATGAGDAFLATLAMGHFRGLDIHRTARMATIAAAMALSHEDTINPDLSYDRLTREEPS